MSNQELKAPRNLSGEARIMWKQIVGKFEGWTFAQPAVLRAGLEAHDRMRQAQRQLKKHGLFSKDRYGQVRSHPCVAVERDSRNAFYRAIKQLDIQDEEKRHPHPGRSSFAV